MKDCGGKSLLSHTLLLVMVCCYNNSNPKAKIENGTGVGYDCDTSEYVVWVRLGIDCRRLLKLWVRKAMVCPKFGEISVGA